MAEITSSIQKLLIEALLIYALLLSPSLAATFPFPTGPFNTTLTIAKLIDYTRLDPYSPIPAHRSVMVSIFQPETCNAISTPYMDATTAAYTDEKLAPFGVPPGTFESLNLQSCRSCDKQTSMSSRTESRKSREQRIQHPLLNLNGHKKTPHPLLLFTPGLGEPRLYYSFLAQQIASRGFTVLTIDHPYDAEIVVYPDHAAIYGANITTDEEILFDVSVRVKDVSFILDTLADASDGHSVMPELRSGFETERVGIFGHSLGGATAAQAMLEDSRLVGGVNFDGSFFGSVIEMGLSNPFLLFAHDGKNISDDASWVGIWPKLKGFKRALELKGSTHGTFLDFLAIIDVLDLKGKLPSEVADLLGSIGGMRGMEILGTYVGAFFDVVLRGQSTTLFDGPSQHFPEIIFDDMNS